MLNEGEREMEGPSDAVVRERGVVQVWELKGAKRFTRIDRLSRIRSNSVRSRGHDHSVCALGGRPALGDG